MNAPKLRFKEFSAFWNFEPGDKIFESISDKNHNSDLPILAITQEHGAIPRDMINYNISVADKSVDSYKVVLKGDFIISLRSFQGGIEYSEYRGICSPAYIILRKKITINDFFYKTYFKTDRYILKLNAKLEGIRDGKMISYKYFSEIKLPYPSLPEQQKIASFFTAVDQKLTALKKKKELLEQYKKGVMQQIFSQKLRFKDENGKSFPDWEEKKLGEVASITIGEFVIKSKQSINGKYPVYNGGRSYTGLYDDFNNEGNKIIISARGANAGFVNYVQCRYWAGNSSYSIGINNDTKNNVIYLFYYLKFQERNYIQNQQAANIPSVSKYETERFKVMLPIYQEQQKIANFLSAIDNKIEAVQKQIEKTEQWKKGLLQQMFV